MFTDKSLVRAIGWGIYGPSFDEAHAEPAIWDHIVSEQDRIVDRVIMSLYANGWRPVHDGLEAVTDA